MFFVKVTATTGQVIIVNLEKVESFQRDENNEYTEITFEHDFIRVVETPLIILSQIPKELRSVLLGDQYILDTLNARVTVANKLIADHEKHAEQPLDTTG
jgi:hypothetical protein